MRSSTSIERHLHPRRIRAGLIDAVQALQQRNRLLQEDLDSLKARHSELQRVHDEQRRAHAAAQSAASLVGPAQAAGVSRFRIELVRQDAAETARTVEQYRGLLAGRITATEVWRALRAHCCALWRTVSHCGTLLRTVSHCGAL